MDQTTIRRLKENAAAIERIRNLHPDEQAWLVPCLNRRILTSLNILDAIANNPLTYEQIADICELHPTSVRQILGALSEGGCSISLSEKTAFAPTGRPRTLARR